VFDVHKFARLGIPIFGSDFWDPHRKRNSNLVYDSEDSGRKFFSQILMSGESENWNFDSKIWNSGPHKKSNTNSFVNTKVHGRKPLPYKTVGELFFQPNLDLLTLNGKRIYTYSHLTENMSRCRFGAKLHE
jgi:hypothetical protein